MQGRHIGGLSGIYQPNNCSAVKATYLEGLQHSQRYGPVLYETEDSYFSPNIQVALHSLR